MTMFDPTSADDLQARLDRLPNDVGITVRVGALQAAMAELRHEADAEIDRWMAAANASAATEPWECGTCGGKVVGPSCAACTVGLAP